MKVTTHSPPCNLSGENFLKKIRIGVDARILSRPLTGIGRYTAELCRALSKQSGVELILYSPAPFFSDLELGSNVHIKTGQWNNGVIKQLWVETILPLWAKKDKLDIFWGPAHRLPHFLSSNIARVVTIHDLVWKYASNTMQSITWLLDKYHIPFAIQCADRIILDCYTTATSIDKEFINSRHKLGVVTPGVTKIKSNLSLKCQQEINLTKPFCLFVGTLEPRKNLLRLLIAYSLLPQSIKESTILVLAGGTGWGNLDIEKKVFSLNLTNHVKIMGYVDEATLAWLYSRALFLVFPSIYEGFGLPLIEAMSYGLPVLTSTTSSMPEIAKDAGILVNPFDEYAICTGLNRLIVDKELRQQLAAKAKKISAPYNWDHSAERLLEEFHKAIAIRRNL